jgi:hypothetical protein
MKLFFLKCYFFAALGLFSTCSKTSKDTSDPCIISSDSLAIAIKLLTLSSAERIMGEQANLTCNTFFKKGDTLEYKCDYTALLKEEKSSKIGKLYFMYEVYSGTVKAKNAYSAIYQANKMHEGVKIETGLGDEAYYHTDGTGFYFYLVRKNQKMFRMKLNKITSHSSESEFKKVAKLIVDMI